MSKPSYYQKSEKSEKSEKTNIDDLSNIKCHWCDQLGHYKKNCEEMEFFIVREERVRHELRYSIKKNTR